MCCSQHGCDWDWPYLKWWAWFGAPFITEDHLKRRLDFRLPCPSSQISISNSKLRILLAWQILGYPTAPAIFFFFLYFHSLLMEQGRLLKMSPCPKRTSRSQKVGVYLPISLSVVLFQIHLKPYCCIPSCQRQAHNLSFSKLWERQLLPLLLEQIGPSAHGRAVREWDARILFREISGFLTRGL